MVGVRRLLTDGLGIALPGITGYNAGGSLHSAMLLKGLEAQGLYNPDKFKALAGRKANSGDFALLLRSAEADGLLPPGANIDKTIALNQAGGTKFKAVGGALGAGLGLARVIRGRKADAKAATKERMRTLALLAGGGAVAGAATGVGMNEYNKRKHASRVAENAALGAAAVGLPATISALLGKRNAVFEGLVGTAVGGFGMGGATAAREALERHAVKRKATSAAKMIGATGLVGGGAYGVHKLLKDRQTQQEKTAGWLGEAARIVAGPSLMGAAGAGAGAGLLGGLFNAGRKVSKIHAAAQPGAAALATANVAKAEKAVASQGAARRARVTTMRADPNMAAHLENTAIKNRDRLQQAAKSASDPAEKARLQRGADMWEAKRSGYRGDVPANASTPIAPLLPKNPSAVPTAPSRVRTHGEAAARVNKADRAVNIGVPLPNAMGGGRAGVNVPLMRKGDAAAGAIAANRGTVKAELNAALPGRQAAMAQQKAARGHKGFVDRVDAVRAANGGTLPNRAIFDEFSGDVLNAGLRGAAPAAAVGAGGKYALDMYKHKKFWGGVKKWTPPAAIGLGGYALLKD